MTNQNLRWLALLTCFACAGGCNVIGVVADKVAGDRPVAPAYVPDPLLSLVVIAENFRDPNNDRSDAYRVQHVLSQQLIENQVAPIVPVDELVAVRERSPTAYRQMSVIDIAESVGARQVIYVDLTSVGVGTQMGSDAIKGIASANVKLIDVATGEVLFPKGIDAGMGVSFESVLHRSGSDITVDGVRAETLLGLSDRIGRLFYSYRPSDLERLGDGE